ncbi:MAG: zinc ribbon domain-containing protein [Christensenellales bacterium]
MGQLDLLWQYQQTELALEQFEAKLKSSPTRREFLRVRNFLVNQQNAIKQYEENILKRQTRLGELSSQYGDLEKTFKTETDKQAETGLDKLKTVESSRKAMEAVQANLIKMRREISDILQALDQYDVQFKDMLNSISKAKKEYVDLKEAHDKELNGVTEELDAYKNKVVQAGKKVDPNLMKRYKSVKKQHAMPVAKIESEKCSGCNMALPSLLTTRLKNSDQVFECENCGRILYMSQ